MYQVQHLVWWYLMGAAAPWFVEQPQQATRPVDHEIVLSESHLPAVNRRRRIFDVEPSCVVRGGSNLQLRVPGGGPGAVVEKVELDVRYGC